MVYIPTLIDIDQFKSYFKEYGGTLATESTYTSNGTTFGDDALAAGAGTDHRHEDEELGRDDRDPALATSR